MIRVAGNDESAMNPRQIMGMELAEIDDATCPRRATVAAAQRATEQPLSENRSDEATDN